MNRRTFLTSLAGIAVLPSTALSYNLVEGKAIVPHPTPTFDEAIRYQFRKDLSICVKSHLPPLPLLNVEQERRYFIEGVTKFMKAMEAKGTVVGPWSVNVLDEGDANIHYQLKTAPEKEEYLVASVHDHPKHVEINFFSKKA